MKYFAPLLLTRLKTTVKYRNPDFKGTLLNLSEHKPLSKFWPWNKKSVSRFYITNFEIFCVSIKMLKPWECINTSIKHLKETELNKRFYLPLK